MSYLMVNDVYEYAEPITSKGLVHLSIPGNDLVTSTALVASGAHIVLFTTGMSTPFGSLMPTVKISTNNELYLKKRKWMDVNAGEVVNGRGIDE